VYYGLYLFSITPAPHADALARMRRQGGIFRSGRPIGFVRLVLVSALARPEFTALCSDGLHRYDIAPGTGALCPSPLPAGFEIYRLNLSCIECAVVDTDLINSAFDRAPARIMADVCDTVKLRLAVRVPVGG
jgi:hypothetical protein